MQNEFWNALTCVLQNEIPSSTIIMSRSRVFSQSYELFLSLKEAASLVSTFFTSLKLLTFTNYAQCCWILTVFKSNLAVIVDFNLKMFL